jgi:hypothetical protein
MENTGVTPPFPPEILTPASSRIALGAILLLAGILRFAALDRQGLLFFDEGHLIMEARTCGKLWRFSAQSLGPGPASSEARRSPAASAACRPSAASKARCSPKPSAALAQSLTPLAQSSATLAPAPSNASEAARHALAMEITNCRITFGKPAHNQALAVILSLCRRADRATFILSASAGVAAVWSLYFLGTTAYGPAAGLAGALILALSPYHLLYSREGLSDSLTVFCWTACLAAWLRSGGLFTVVSGIMGGLCVATNYRDLFLPLLILACSGKRILRYGAWLAVFGLTVAAFEVPYRIWLAAAADPAVRFPQGTYLRQLGDLLSFHGAQGFGLSGFSAFGHHLARWEGVASLGFLVAVLPFQFARWRGTDSLVNLGLILPWLLFSAYWDNAPRFFTPLLPLIALVKGRWLMAGTSRLSRLGVRSGAPARAWSPAAARTTVILVTVAILAFPLAPALRLVPRPTPYLEAAGFLLRSGAPRHASTSMRLGRAYLGEEQCLPAPVSPSEIPRLRRQGIRYAVIDAQAMFGGFERPAERYATSLWLASCCPAVREFPYGETAIAQFILEQDLGFSSALRILANLEPLHPRLTVIDLSDCRFPCTPRPHIPAF